MINKLMKGFPNRAQGKVLRKGIHWPIHTRFPQIKEEETIRIPIVFDSRDVHSDSHVVMQGFNRRMPMKMNEE